VAETEPFVALSECHLMNPQTLSEVGYYPDVHRWWRSVEGVMRAWAGRSLENAEWPAPIASELVKWMDAARVDVCFALREPMMDVTGGVTSLSTNGFVLQQIEPWPDRLYLECNVGPILRRGVRHAIWELEYLVRERNAKLCKVYAPEDDGPLDDRRLWPFYERACELGIALTVHTGQSYVVPQPSRHSMPETLDQVLIDFPELQVIAYHMGWPRSEELIGLAGKHANLHLSLSGIVGWLERAPHRAYHLIGTALQWVSHERIVMGLALPFDDMPRVVDFVRTLQIPEELRAQWGYPEITPAMRAAFLGTNLARLAKIEPKKRV
jgi:hypothetical protein